MPRLRTALALIGLLVANAGCYRYVPYVPAPGGAAAPGTQLRARLTEAGQNEVRGFFGADMESVDGPLVRWNEDGVSLLIRSQIQRQGFPPTSFTDTLHLPSRHLESVEIRQLDRWRTAGVAALVAGSAVAAVFAPRVLGGGTGSGEGGGEGDPTDPNNQILIKIPLGFPFR